mmetsp:Transcript_12191/g.26884  ORF Transcript_12191/g.26884 Transcript_12191/m.26884 type:complete len:245 (-) Transcript_12191:259-993(-)
MFNSSKGGHKFFAVFIVIIVVMCALFVMMMTMMMVFSMAAIVIIAAQKVFAFGDPVFGSHPVEELPVVHFQNRLAVCTISHILGLHEGGEIDSTHGILGGHLLDDVGHFFRVIVVRLGLNIGCTHEKAAFSSGKFVHGKGQVCSPLSFGDVDNSMASHVMAAGNEAVDIFLRNDQILRGDNAGTKLIPKELCFIFNHFQFGVGNRSHRERGFRQILFFAINGEALDLMAHPNVRSKGNNNCGNE